MAHVLVADDLEVIRTSVAIVLRQAGHTCDLAGGSEEILDAVEGLADQGKKYDLLVMDYNFDGDLDGLSVLDIVQEQFGPQRVIMLSAHNDKFVFEEARDRGAMDWILKPINAEEFLKKIGTVLGASPVN